MDSWDIDVIKKKPPKTQYCLYHMVCGRPEDCFEGEYCPVYRLNDAFPVVYTEIDKPKPFEEIMDEIWDGT